MRYWNDNRKSCEHVEPREDWKESIEKWIDWMDAIGRTNDTLRTRWYQIVRFSKAVDKSITDVTEDDLIFYLAGMGTEGRRGVRSCVKVFYQWSMKRGLARRNPADEVPTVPMTLPSGCICPEENIEQGLASPDENARLAVMLGLPVTGLEERPDYADALRRAGAEKVLCGPYAENLTQWRAVRRPTLLSPPAPTPSTWNALPEYTRNDLPTLVCWAAEAGRPCPPPAHRGRNCPGKGRRTPRSHWSGHQGADSAGNCTIHPRGDR